MKIMTIFLLMGIFSVSAKVYSQDTKVSIRLENKSVKDVFYAIKSQTDYSFWYDTEDVNVNESVSIKVKNEKVYDVLKDVLKNQNVDFTMIGNHIVIAKKGTLDIALEKQQQSKKQIKGIVSDENGDPIIGANVIEKGTTSNGTMTDRDGKFVLDVYDNATLIVSYIGYSQKEVITKGESTLSIVLSEDTKALDEVVVVGYGTQKKTNLTGAVSQVNMSDVIADRAVINAGSALQGVIPGLKVTRNSTPGQNDNSFQIRGDLSINGGSPLVLIDGVPGSINMLNPNDIETVSVLKDAASAAIYGAKAAGGVILITTKRPKGEAKFTLDYSNSFGSQSVADQAIPQQTSLENYLQAYTDAEWGSGVFWAGDNTYISKWQEYLQKYKNDPSSLNVVGDGIYRDEAGGTYYLNEKNLYKNLFESSFQMSHNISASGGTKTLRYRMSAGYSGDDGPLLTSKDKYIRKNVKGYISADLTKWITLDMDLSYTQTNKKMPGAPLSLYVLNLGSYYPEGDMPAEISGLDYDLPIFTPKTRLMKSNIAYTNYESPRVFLKSTIKPIKDLDVVFEYAYNRDNVDYHYYSGQYEYTTIQFGSSFNPSSDYYIKEKYYTDKNNINVYGTYNKKIEEHEFKLMAGFNQESYYYESFEGKAYDQAVQTTPSFGGATGTSTVTDEYSEYTTRSGFYRINYNYKNKYLIETNGRYDGSSKFPKDSRFGFFPSVSAGWHLGKESFMDFSDKWLNELKIRASYGSIGNQAINPYKYTPSMAVSKDNTNLWLNNSDYVTVIGTPGLVSSDFTWETVTSLDLGADFSLFGNKLKGGFDWYQRDTKDMLTAGVVQLPATVGADAPEQNTAKMRTRGWEVNFTWSDKIGKLGYRLGFNLSDYQSEIVDYYNNESGLISDYYKGRKLGEIWGYVADGYYTIDDFSDYNSWALKDGVASIQSYNVKPGDLKFKNLNDDEGSTNQIDAGTSTVDDPGDRKIIGNTTPRYQYGANLGLSYEGFDFSMVIQGVGKRDYWLGSSCKDLLFPFNGGSYFYAVFDDQTDYWKPISTDVNDANYMVAENPNAKYFRIYNQMENAGSNTRVSDKYISDASYCKIKSISLSYTFPNKWLKKYTVSRLKLFANVENVVTFTSLPKGVDPELMSWEYPFYRTISCGLNVTF